MSGEPPRVLDRSLLRDRAQVVAPMLLGCLLVAGQGEDRVAVRIDEVEAYAGVGEDPGSHAHRGLRARHATMFGEPGSLYVYFTYGMHWCANVVVHGPGSAGAVLLRAGEVVHGHDVARGRRPTARTDRDLARGPARLTRALGIDGRHDGLDLLGGVAVDGQPPDRPQRGTTEPAELPAAGQPLLLPGPPPDHVAAGPRVGVSGDGAATPWRWWDARSRHVSAYRAASVRPRRGGASTGGHG